MSPQAWLLAGTIVTATGTLFSAWLLQRRQGKQSKTVDAQQIIDQLQENRRDDDERHRREIAEVSGRMEKLETRVRRMESRELVFFDYIAALRWHIEQRNQPPPPPWPAALMNRT